MFANQSFLNRLHPIGINFLLTARLLSFARYSV
jgi:hypothetical protein